MFCNWNIDPVCCDGWDELPVATQTAATNYASTILWAATGRMFGLCEKTVRPCGRWCQQKDVAGWTWNAGFWTPYISAGVWRNCWCGCGAGPGCCSCAPSCQVYIPGPVASITQVIQHGVVVDPSAYRLDDNKWLVRTDGECWIECQNYDEDSGLGGAENTLQVTYMQGLPIPDALLVAAGNLACEFAKACQNLDCRLPARLSTVARQGVQLTFQNVDDLVRYGLTGLPEVDQVIVALNPYGIKSRMRVISPDLPVVRETTIP